MNIHDVYGEGRRQQGQIGYSNRCNNNISQHNMLTLILAVGGNYEVCWLWSQPAIVQEIFQKGLIILPSLLIAEDDFSVFT